ncbi:harmonin-binding protein USHBP1 isoform X2 [Ascaphus truei]|uniref:harmonin-binding protein USHBP1 isoform X2 n=1 Tax=Ascaphus truei TaxID=8439 RepID=UPI003F59991C
MDDSRTEEFQGLAEVEGQMRYEEAQMTELLLTLTNPNHKGQQPHGERDEGMSGDRSSQCGSSLSRGLCECRDMAESPTSGQSCEKLLLTGCCTGVSDSDLFSQLQEAVTSLESCVWSWRSPPVGSGPEEGVGDELPPVLPVQDLSWFQSEISRYQEQNAGLMATLRATDKELDRSKVALLTFTEERDTLQETVKKLQDSLQDSDPLAPQTLSPTSSPVCGAQCSLTSDPPIASSDNQPRQDPLSTLQSLIQCLQSLPGLQRSLPGAPESPASDMEAETVQLRGHVDYMKRQNDLLSVTLEECKSDSERLSMQLGKQESNCTALCLALQSSENCLKTYSVLLALAEAKEEVLLGQVTGGDTLSSGWSLLPKDLEIKTKLLMMEVKKTFRIEGLISEAEKRDTGPPRKHRFYSPWLSEDDEQTLKAYIRSLKWDLSSITVTLLGHLPTGQDGISQLEEVAHLADVIKARVDDVIKASLDALPGQTEKPKSKRAEVLQELIDTREGLSQLRANLQLLQTEKRALELQSLAQPEQQKAYLLISDLLQRELDEWVGAWRDEDSGSTDSNSSAEEYMGQQSEAQGPGGRSEHIPDMQSLLDSLARSSEMRVCVQSLTSELHKLTSNVRAQGTQSAQIITDFFKAHRNLLLTYHNARRKYQGQQHRLEAQAALMSQRQREQLQRLMRDIQTLQEQRAARVTGETSL